MHLFASLLFSLTLTLSTHPTLASLMLEGTSVTNIWLGGGSQEMTFELNMAMVFSIKNHSKTSYRVGSDYYDHVYIGAETYSTRIDMLEGNRVTLGWYASQNQQVTVMGPEVFPFIEPKMLLGDGIALDRDFNGQTFFHRPDGTKQWVDFVLLPDTNIFYFPRSYFLEIDRTLDMLFAFPALALTLNSLEGDLEFTIQGWDQDRFGLGLGHANHILALTVDTGQLRAWGGWNEQIQYTTETQLYIFGLAAIALCWYLYLSGIDTLMPVHIYDTKSVLLSYVGSFLALLVVVRNLTAYNLFTRMQYVTPTPIYEYTLFVGPLLALVLLIHLYTTWKFALDLEIRRATFDTILASAVASIFVGRTEICEETVVCLIIAGMWMPFQLMSVVRCPGPGRWLILFQFAALYPLVAIILVEPIISTVPELVDVAWPTSQLIMFLPPLLLLGLWTTFPTWQKQQLG